MKVDIIPHTHIAGYTLKARSTRVTQCLKTYSNRLSRHEQHVSVGAVDNLFRPRQSFTQITCMVGLVTDAKKA